MVVARGAGLAWVAVHGSGRRGSLRCVQQPPEQGTGGGGYRVYGNDVFSFPNIGVQYS